MWVRNLPPGIKNLNVISTFLAGLSLVISFQAYRHSDSQFELINQSYIKSECQTTFLTTDRAFASLRGTAIPDTFPCVGITLSIKVQNLGNIPLHYTVTKGELYYNDALMGKDVPDSSLSTRAILYPKEEGSYKFAEYHFPDSKILTVRELRYQKIILKFVIEYSDFNSTNKRTVDRVYNLHINPDNTSVLFNMEINDKI